LEIINNKILINNKGNLKMKTRIVSIIMSVAILMLFINSALFAQNKPVTKETKNNTQTTYHTSNQKNVVTTEKQATNTPQKDMKKNNNVVTTSKQTDHATMTKDNKNKESVNTQYHKKEGTTNNNKQMQEKTPTKGGGNK
jgi:heme/copper-type cytochrome/quinol oxidase subunit 1